PAPMKTVVAARRRSRLRVTVDPVVPAPLLAMSPSPAGARATSVAPVSGAGSCGGPFERLVGHRQGQLDAGAEPGWRGGDRDGATVPFDDVSADRQAQPGAVVLGGPRAFEGTEDPGAVLQRDPDAVVDHPDP